MRHEEETQAALDAALAENRQSACFRACSVKAK
jgi:hypothetical protein